MLPLIQDFSAVNEGIVILSVDTATPSGGVCVCRGNEVLASISSEPDLSHSNTLLRDIRSALTNASLALGHIDLFAVAKGPGSFTGLRIGLATVKALAATLERPCIGVPTLHAVARAAGTSAATVALLPAGRGELFAQLLSLSESIDVTELDSPAHLSPGSVIEKYGSIRDLIWSGTGAHTQKELLAKAANDRGLDFDETGAKVSGWRLAAAQDNLALQIAFIARTQSINSDKTAELLQALYVRPSDPELKNVSN